jgi:hypothetical protein
MYKLSASDPKKIGGNSNAYMLLSRIWFAGEKRYIGDS